MTAPHVYVDKQRTGAGAEVVRHNNFAGLSIPCFILIVTVRFSVEVCVTDMYIGHLRKYGTNRFPYWFKTGCNI